MFLSILVWYGNLTLIYFKRLIEDTLDGFMSLYFYLHLFLLLYYFCPVSFLLMVNLYHHFHSLKDTLERNTGLKLHKRKVFNIPQLKFLFSEEKYNNLFNFVLRIFPSYIKTSSFIKKFLLNIFFTSSAVNHLLYCI